jgi:hypothetical protein
MEKTCLEQLVKEYYEVLDFVNQSFENIVRCYEAVIDHLFSDNIFNRGRFFTVDYFAVYITNRAVNVNKYELLRALREKLDVKWHFSLISSDRG